MVPELDKTYTVVLTAASLVGVYTLVECMVIKYIRPFYAASD